MEDKGFKVVDKRISSRSEGSSFERTEELKAGAEKAHPIMPPVDFSNLIISLSTASLIHLGEIPDPTTNKKEGNIELARHTIDTIAMLKEKTKGNLTDEEEKLIDAILYDLRMRYVNLTK